MNTDHHDYSTKLQNAHKVIEELFIKYENNPYILERTYNYVCLQLPNHLDGLDKNREQRISRIEELNAEQNAFINDFISKNQYFYVSSTELFYRYDGKHYCIYNEDDILHQILSMITKDKQLMCWKQRTKVYIMKRIKENNLLKTVPESYTIQNVLAILHPTIFATRNEAKYFLTIIGDNIFKKNGHLIHFIHSNSKHFIRELNALCQGFLGTNLFQTVKHKYHEHNYQHSRILRINDIIKNEAIWRPLLITWVLDILCVACHYSMRFNCSDDFLLHANDDSLCKSALYLHRNDPNTIVDHFISEYLQKTQRQNTRITRETQTPTNDNSEMVHKDMQYNGDDNEKNHITGQITWKNMQYLWKHFLESKNLPSILFQHALKTIFTQKLAEYYVVENDSFVGIFSKHLPAIQRFIYFWEETISTQDDDIENDFEIDEVSILFKIWCENQGETMYSFSHSQLLDLIGYFYPYIEIDQCKYLYKINCSLWDKQTDVQMVLETIEDTNTKLTMYDAYKYYCQNCSFAKQSLIVSKSYFEKYVNTKFSHCIV